MEFIFQNPIFIIVIIGYIISFFMKNKKNQTQHQKGDRSKPSTAEIFKQFQDRTPTLDTGKLEEQQRQQAEQSQKLEKESLEREWKAAARSNALKEHKQIAEKRAELITEAESPALSSKVLPTNSKGSNKTMSPSKKQLIDGIIWSEIIGPPRALNPHKSIKNNNK